MCLQKIDNFKKLTDMKCSFFELVQEFTRYYYNLVTDQYTFQQYELNHLLTLQNACRSMLSQRLDNKTRRQIRLFHSFVLRAILYGDYPISEVLYTTYCYLFAKNMVRIVWPTKEFLKAASQQNLEDTKNEISAMAQYVIRHSEMPHQVADAQRMLRYM